MELFFYYLLFINALVTSRMSICLSLNCSTLTHEYSRSLPWILCAIVVQCWREPALQLCRYQTADKMLTKKTLESKQETAGAILAEQSRAAVEMSDSHSESLPKATIWSLKLHCMDNLLLCTRKKGSWRLSRAEGRVLFKACFWKISLT